MEKLCFKTFDRIPGQNRLTLTLLVKSNLCDLAFIDQFWASSQGTKIDLNKKSATMQTNVIQSMANPKSLIKNR